MVFGVQHTCEAASTNIMEAAKVHVICGVQQQLISPRLCLLLVGVASNFIGVNLLQVFVDAYAHCGMYCSMLK